tara:strand:- start:512 stop:1261 length:750 start_codon:yes stop_codon:yes gene_type:complete
MNNKKNYNKHIADNLRSAISSQGLTQEQVAKKAGITPKTLRNMLSGSARIDVNLAAEIYSSLGYAPESVIKPPKAISVLTGVRSIDTMLNRVYTQHEFSGIAVLGEYVSDDYRCCSPIYNDWDREVVVEPFYPVLTKKKDGVELWGMSYESELRLTEINRQEQLHTIEPLHATIVSPNIIAISILRTTTYDKNNLEGIGIGIEGSFAVKHGCDYLTLDTPIKNITKDGASFKIRLKTWNHQDQRKIQNV